MTYAAHLLDGYGVEIYFARKQSEWKSLRKRLGILDKKAPRSMGMTRFAIWQPNHPGTPIPTLVIWIDKQNVTDPVELVDTCAHEASHAVAEIFDYIGHEVKGIDEPSAYLVGWLTAWLWERTAPDTMIST